jgi:hypothetical protein
MQTNKEKVSEVDGLNTDQNVWDLLLLALGADARLHFSSQEALSFRVSQYS